eukprot:CAMPEP_0113616130 /NCGR_PEP_ID=MMETSP0017_2-20120614/8076_1 /TAXON_ID=2856 /ORGANISM="Cylindrotheca closterium" /LENGTH=142 /DNA_ID=CAMNT_0000525425 /DNA_START=102 /DNA_END=527 /DNA_ORIENTATION=+ /assembly_acc=CAM_ASM_000147
MSYTSISNINYTWELVRKIENYEETIGVQVVQKFFMLQPDAKLALGFPIDMDPASTETMKNPRFVKKASWFLRILFQMMSQMMDLLGSNVELVTDILLELGERHERYGVKPEFYPNLGKALIDTLEENLNEKEFNQLVKADW